MICMQKMIERIIKMYNAQIWITRCLNDSTKPDAVCPIPAVGEQTFPEHIQWREKLSSPRLFGPWVLKTGREDSDSMGSLKNWSDFFQFLGLETKISESNETYVWWVLLFLLTLGILRTFDQQAPLSIRFPRQEYWSGLPYPSPFSTTVVYKKKQTYT